MGLFHAKNSGKSKAASVAVQTGLRSSQPFRDLDFYVPLSAGCRIYKSLREGVPIIDAAIEKLVRLTGGFRFDTGSDALNEKMNEYFDSVNVGGNQWGLGAFISTYLDQLLTYGNAIGEMIIAGRDIMALYNGEPDAVEVKRAKNGIDIQFYNNGIPLPRPEEILYSVLNPEPGKLTGTSLLRGLPFVSRILLQIYNTVGENWEHAGNLRYAVTYKPGSDSTDRAYAAERAKTMAKSWQEAMDSGSVKDFVAVGDVDVKVIGADNQVLDSEIPVRQMLEQIVAKTGLPPFMFGLSWSTTERMSTQQADILTTELENYRRILTPVIKKIGRTYLNLQGVASEFEVVWNDITLQDETEKAKAELYYAQAEKIRKETESQ